MGRLASRVLLLLMAAGCDQGTPLQNLSLPVVEYWPEQQLLFLATPRSGHVDLLRVPASPRQGSLDFVERLTDPARQEVLRLAVDRTKGRLWVADRRAVYIYELLPRGQSKEISFGGRGEVPITDLVIDESGNGYVFLAAGARIHRIASQNLQSEKWFETTYASPQSTAPLGARGLLTKDGREVLFQSPKDGTLLRLDLASKKASKISRATPIPLDCAILLWNHEERRDTPSASISAFHCRGRWRAELGLDTTLSASKERYLRVGP